MKIRKGEIPNAVCFTCGRPIRKLPSHLSKHKIFFCNIDCKNQRVFAVSDIICEEIPKFIREMFPEGSSAKTINRLWEKSCISKLNSYSDTPCLEWCGYNFKGYGLLCGGKKQIRTHRLSFMNFYPEIDIYDYHVCHHCDNPPCWNPLHLFRGTDLDNSRDRTAKGRTYDLKITRCLQGHEYTIENTVIKIDKLGVTHRGCRICINARNPKRYHDKSKRIRPDD